MSPGCSAKAAAARQIPSDNRMKVVAALTTKRMRLGCSTVGKFLKNGCTDPTYFPSPGTTLPITSNEPTYQVCSAYLSLC